MKIYSLRFKDTGNAVVLQYNKIKDFTYLKPTHIFTRSLFTNLSYMLEILEKSGKGKDLVNIISFSISEEELYSYREIIENEDIIAEEKKRC